MYKNQKTRLGIQNYFGKDKNLKIDNGCSTILLSLQQYKIIVKMGFLDLVLGGLLVYGLLRGIWNGFFVELASFVSLIIGIYLAIKFSYLAKIFLIHHFSWNSKTIQIIAFIVTFIIVVLAITALAKFLTTAANFASLGLINKLFGGLLGLIKTILILGIFLNFIQKFNKNNFFIEKNTIDKSLFYNPIHKVSEFIYPSLEKWFEDLKKIDQPKS